MGNEVTAWTQWLRDTMKDGLAARWDAENWERFRVNGAPAPVGPGSTAVVVPPPGALVLSPLMLLGGAVVLSASLYFLLRD